MLEGMAACHTNTFPDQFTSYMGAAYTMAFYRTYIEAGAIAFAVVHGRDVVGMVVGGDPEILSRFRKKAVVWFLPRIVIKLLTDMRIALYAYRGLSALQLWGQKLAQTNSDTEGVSLLQVIAVRESFRGCDVSGLLIKYFEKESHRRGCRLLRLTVDPLNARAVAFYRKYGWRDVATNGKTLIMEKECS